MRFSKIIVILSILLGISTAYAEDFESAYIQQFAGISARMDTTSLWPGFQFNAQPLILGFNAKDSTETHLYAFNFHPQGAAWQALSYANKPIYYLPYDGIGFTAFKVTWDQPYLIVDGQSAIPVLLSLAAGENSSEELTFNNRMTIGSLFIYFELLQSPYAKDLIKQEIANEGYPYDEYNKPESVTWLLLENAILDNYLKTQNPESLKDYLAVYQTRENSLETAALNAEDTSLHSRFHYIYLKAIHPSASEMVSDLMTQTFSITAYENTPPGYGDLMGMTYDSQDYLVTAIALALDKLEPGWQQKVESNQASVNGLLKQHYKLNQAEINARVNKVKTDYQYATILEKVNNKLGPYLKEMAQEQENYNKLPGIEMILPVGDYSVYYYNHYSLNKNKSLFVDIIKAEMKDDSETRLELVMKTLPFLYFETLYSDSELGEQLGKARLKLSLDTQFNLDGVIFTLDNFIKQKSKLNFHILSIQDKTKTDFSIIITAKNSEGATLELVDKQLVVGEAAKPKHGVHFALGQPRRMGQTQLIRGNINIKHEQGSLTGR